MRILLLLAAGAATLTAQTIPEVPVAPPAKVREAVKWTIRYFHDEDKSTLQLADFAFAGEQYGLAVGVVVDERGRTKGTGLITRDGGAKWSLIPLKDPPLSVFPLGEGRFFYVAPKALYYTSEGGAQFEKRKAPQGLERVFFFNENRGFGIGSGKTVWKTADGARTWAKVPESEKLQVRDEWSGMTAIDFPNEKDGAIAGFSRAPRYQSQPDWVDPERATRRRQLPGTAIVMETHDGGATWRTQLSSLFGVMTKFGMRGGLGLSLFNFEGDFDWPSEVHEIDARLGKARLIFRRKDVIVTDLQLRQDGSAVLAGIQPAGRLRDTPVPGKVRVFVSPDRTAWSEYEVDYKAFGHRVMLAGAGGRTFLATDAGMILALEAKDASGDPPRSK